MGLEFGGLQCRTRMPVPIKLLGRLHGMMQSPLTPAETRHPACCIEPQVPRVARCRIACKAELSARNARRSCRNSRKHGVSYRVEGSGSKFNLRLFAAAEYSIVCNFHARSWYPAWCFGCREYISLLLQCYYHHY